jgi:dienelactone hydrolase
VARRRLAGETFGMIRHIAIAFCLCLPASLASAQLRFLYPAPPPDTYSVMRDVQYGASGGTPLMMDVYRPRTGTSPASPALIFFNRAAGENRRNAFYSGWAQTAASKGVVAILPDLRSGTEAQDFELLVPYLARHATELGVDPDAIAVYAGSGNVFTAFPIVEDPKQTAIKAAVMYYGGAQIQAFRRDLPVLYVRAGLDRPDLNQSITAIAARAITENAPITLLNHPTGHHAFEMRDDDDATRAIIDQTIAFVKHATAAAYQSALRRQVAEAGAAAHVQTGNFAEAAKAYASLVAARPDDATLRLAYGEALLGDRQFAPACDEFEKLKGKGLGPRDLGLPAARACMQKGDAEAAIAWLRSIPQRFLPPSVAKEPVFASIQGRADFQALFQPR